MQVINTDLLISLIDILIKTIALLIGGAWALLKIKEYREFKNWIQLDIDANIYELNEPENVKSISWDKRGNPQHTQRKNHTHAVEIQLHFRNQGKTRVRIYNIQLGVNTMRSVDEARFDESDGHLHLSRCHTSGNLVPIFEVKGKPINKTSFYYIEPNVKQTITHLCLVSEPRELLQIAAYFSLEQERLFPKAARKKGGLFPHSAARTYQLDTR